MNTNTLISIVSPVYNAENIVKELVKEIITNVSIITENFEIILVNDCSPDNSWRRIKEECSKDKRVKGLHLSRNFGQHYAITAGLNYVNGQWIVVMDCDLQDRPDEIPNLFVKANEGWDFVRGRRTNRKDNYLKKLSSRMFYGFLNYLSGNQNDFDLTNFGIYHIRVIKEFLKLHEQARDFSFLVNTLGFKNCTIQVEHGKRFEGKSSYNFHKLLNLSLDIVLSNTNKPLKLTVKLGFFVSFVSFILAIYNVIANLLGIINVPGYTTTVFSIWFVGGLILFVLGIVGLYIGKIFDQVKARQLFIVSKEINFF